MSPTIIDLLTLDELAQHFSRSPANSTVWRCRRRLHSKRRAGRIRRYRHQRRIRARQDRAPGTAGDRRWIAERALGDPRVRATVAEATPTAGFINLRLVPEFWQRTVSDVLRHGAGYGRGPARSERISLEFGSANPTGPLVVVQGRTLSIGDTLAKAMRFAG